MRHRQTKSLAFAAALMVAACGDTPSEPTAAGLRLADVLGDSRAAGFQFADRVVPFQFPDDHGPHPGFRSEWWYLTVALRSPGGDEFGVQFTLFRQALRPAEPQATEDAWRSGQVYLGHLAVTDVNGQRHHEAERLARGHPRLAGVDAAPFAAWIEGWRLASEGTSFLPLRLTGTTPEFAVDLVFTDARPPTPQGDRGLSPKGPDQASYYYSIPRMTATGTLRLPGGTVQVSGLGWIDREWSTSVLAEEYAGWDWFALHLDDGRDLMVFQLRRRDGLPDDHDQGLLIDADGPRPLDADDFSLAVEREWRDRRHVRWPVGWRLRIGGDTLLVEAALDDQVMDTSIRYWEGLVRVHTLEGQRVGGGYMELTGYR